MDKRLGDDTLIVIPAKNESAHVAVVVKEALEVANHVLVVDDASVDGTGALASRAGAHTLRHASSRGQGGAVWSGVVHARSRGFQYVITLDADGAHSPRDAFSVHAGLKAGAEVVVGSRFLDRSRLPNMPTAKVAANRFGTALLNSVLQREFTDVASGMRGLAYRALEIDYSVRDFAFAFEVLTVAVDRNLALVEVPISVRYDASEPHFTSRREILDFFGFVREMCERRDVPIAEIAELERRLTNGEHIVVGLHGDDYYFHAVASEWYLVQQQDSWFKAHGAFNRPVRVDLTIWPGR